MVSAIRRNVDRTGDVPEMPILQLLDDTRKSVEEDTGRPRVGPVAGAVRWGRPLLGGHLAAVAVHGCLLGGGRDEHRDDLENHRTSPLDRGEPRLRVHHGGDVRWRHRPRVRCHQRHRLPRTGSASTSTPTAASSSVRRSSRRSTRHRSRTPVATDRAAPATPGRRAEDMEAGAALRGLVRTAFTYKGSFAYRFRFGTADTCFAPIYELLTTKRGVKVEFFHRVESLQLDSTADIDRAIERRGPGSGHGGPGRTRRLQPIVDVHGLSCWPASPRGSNSRGAPFSTSSTRTSRIPQRPDPGERDAAVTPRRDGLRHRRPGDPRRRPPEHRELAHRRESCLAPVLPERQDRQDARLSRSG